jgi:hypothetical protein
MNLITSTTLHKVPTKSQCHHVVIQNRLPRIIYTDPIINEHTCGTRDWNELYLPRDGTRMDSQRIACVDGCGERAVKHGDPAYVNKLIR